MSLSVNETGKVGSQASRYCRFKNHPQPTSENITNNFFISGGEGIFIMCFSP